MDKSIGALINILEKQQAQYMEIEGIEVEKTSVIMKRDGIRLQELSEQLERVVAELDETEQNRKDIAALIAKGLGLSDNEVNISALEQYLPVERLDRLKNITASLTKTMAKVQRLNELNNRCLMDNIDFFNQIMNSLRESVAIDEGYSAGGSVRRSSTSSALFNRTV